MKRKLERRVPPISSGVQVSWVALWFGHGWTHSARLTSKETGSSRNRRENFFKWLLRLAISLQTGSTRIRRNQLPSSAGLLLSFGRKKPVDGLKERNSSKKLREHCFGNLYRRDISSFLGIETFSLLISREKATCRANSYFTIMFPSRSEGNSLSRTATFLQCGTDVTLQVGG